MTRNLLAALLMACLPVLASAAGDNPSDVVFAKANPTLNPQEKAAVAIGQKWQMGSDTSKPFAGSDGAIRFNYNPGQQTQVMCAVLQICDVALQPGEQVTGLNVGDQRFVIEPAISGSGASETLHLIIKPMDIGLDTTAVVTTNRRVYHFRLRSSAKEFMPFISFSYPEDALAKWELVRARDSGRANVAARAEGNGGGNGLMGGERIDSLSFNYEISGSASFKPVRVYNNGMKTYIEFPKKFAEGDAPVLLVVRKDGGLISDEETQMVNYRPDPAEPKRLVVDAVFDKAILLAGAGSSQQRITITRGN